MNASREILQRIFTLILEDAHNRREGAGYSGRMDDGGAGVLEAQVEYYQMGMEGRLPHAWESYFNQAVREADPEYAEYVRLKRKFE